jgi:hypothetical protein
MEIAGCGGIGGLAVGLAIDIFALDTLDVSGVA